MQVSEAEKELYIETAKQFKGHNRRMYMARVVRVPGHGGQTYAEREFGWNRKTISKGTGELETGLICYDNFAARGRERAETHLPDLPEDIKEIADRHSQTDPKFQSVRLYLRLSAASVRKQLIEQKGYTDEQLPGEETVWQRLNELGYRLKRVKKVTL